ncbi:MFS transporter [Syntrophus aciditrophicus]|uniref:Fosmidomycin resistance protein n=1 Tax=Syntrophus aciditrophicus (strain SB) TaxID=56780 RepID=Q2LW73_SYNAS|nr:MFS transporter [Syntrophus aciditrophicus]ABC78329.1 fosmidomycin resistance protein [Syntrophus aciditrophicus SB]
MRRFNFKILLLLSLGHLVTDIYQGALPVILPFLKESLSLSYTLTGVILMTANFTSSLIQPLLGFLSDKQDKPLLLPLGCFCSGLGLSLLAIPSSYIVVLGLVVISGLGVASYHPEGYKTAYYFTGEKRATGMAIFSVGGNLGFALGPLIAIFVVKYFGLSSLPLIMLPSLLFPVILFFYWDKITSGRVDKKPAQETPHKIAGTTYLSLLILVGIVMMRSWIQMGLMSYIPFYYIDYLQGDPLHAGALVSVFLMGGVFGTLGGSPLADRWGHQRYLTLSMLLASIVLPLIFVARGIFLFAVLGLLGMILISTFTVTVVMAQRLLPRNLGIASGLMVGFAIGAGGFCVTLLGVIADSFGVPFALKSIAILPFIGFLLSLSLKYQRTPDRI